ncbi:phospholipid scramblase 1 [Orbilia oligospora]|uniref:Phospholipid scramblase 1 n=1 Tax=Orbilia oligospora TaxID=2813651 RepID=A0A7C8K2B2_ORBOL|nr:phospholipid scramblase 1 [Orbilia oligospora]KAF3186966.1 phospholipid scramblase 1 [Orbilia oligospora]KAF3248894.1 phospholipid scramblase 1 [Orbilia oligospora]KAF3272548.1 phospholipid scramblase 1 [Orbilia oligospora]KAF3293166.1 phospholipid scramblase 1 [Orbilia oligospora]
MNKLLGFFLFFDILQLGSAILLIIAGHLFMQHMDTMKLDVENSPYVILLYHLPCTPIFVNGIISAVAFMFSLPAVLLPQSLFWLRLHGWMLVVCAVYSLVLGILVWVDTLTERAQMYQAWIDVGPTVQTLLQQKFECCGYVSAMEPLFVTDKVCPNALAASQTKPCVGPFTAFEDEFFNTVFTALFGIVGLDFVMLCCTAMVINQRKEQRRYRRIDEKRGLGAI